MLRSFLVLFITVAAANCYAATVQQQLYSPDKNIRVDINTVKGLTYTVYADGTRIILPSVIDMELLTSQKLSQGLRIKSMSRRRVNEVITAPVPDKRKQIPEVYNELTIQFKNGFGVIFRVYNDGVAYRITTGFKNEITVKDETAKFSFPAGAHAYAPIIHKREGQDVYHTSFEEQYPYKALDSLSADSFMYSPVLVALDKGFKVGLTESDLDDYPGMFLRGNSASTLTASFAPYPLKERVQPGDYPQKVVAERANYIATTQGTRSFPWRVMIIARQDKELPGNDLVYRLASPSKIKDTSWIHPGQSTDEWIIDINLFNVPFKAGLNTASYKYYIDFAKRFGFERIMMDAGWSDNNDLFKINPAINMDTLAAYAKKQGVKLSMWTLSMTLDRQLDSALKQFQKWGVDFIMTDFIDRDDQPVLNFYKRITQACADKHIMTMFHGAYPPKGFNRTYPNNITREGVLGSEYNIWSDKPTPAHNLTLPFTRMLAGPMDYEPGLLNNAAQGRFIQQKGNPMSQGTRSNQLAMFVVYDNPLQIFSGNPSQGYLEPKFMELLGSLPTVWDETVILDAKVASYIVTARKKGNQWFIAGMTVDARDISVDLDLLDSATYDAVICTDGVNADHYGSDYSIDTKHLTKKDKLPIHMAAGGGFLIKLTGKERDTY
ncbi:glycoside hydrolase family 97 protein [Mucilaginibacter sp. 14171R-50]|uniref:glycoside hydrolase family 97 protein n=1 Tax=Mucilaginibacter sp. 14171R-50 TaxID=2703789 RepID=UPI00138CC487|nr:glycoside hydrolase family 97 protein [Mucilaginibacter sp. 14171R-50]QHS56651.1 glycoside hydrolase family 97 protein [Mucilaginibacter sp. 14171R-50]